MTLNLNHYKFNLHWLAFSLRIYSDIITCFLQRWFPLRIYSDNFLVRHKAITPLGIYSHNFLHIQQLFVCVCFIFWKHLRPCFKFEFYITKGVILFKQNRICIKQVLSPHSTITHILSPHSTICRALTFHNINTNKLNIFVREDLVRSFFLGNYGPAT